MINIYKITIKNTNYAYVGQTKHNIHTRLQQHLAHNKFLIIQLATNKIKRSDIKIELIATVSEQEANEIEFIEICKIYFSSKYRCFNSLIGKRTKKNVTVKYRALQPITFANLYKTMCVSA